MNVYRAYVLNADGKIAGAPKVLRCHSDDEAIKLAKPLVNGHDIEVWQGDRMVTRLQPEKE